MRFKQQVLKTVCIVTIGLCSCSQKITIPSQVAYTPVPVFNIPDSLFKEARIDFALHEVKPAHFYEPTLEIRDSFTYWEKHFVSASDEDLFARRPELVVNLEDIEEGTFNFPLSGARVLSHFGRRNGRMHQGIDLKINRRDTVTAAFDGIVRMAGWSRGYGNVIVIRHYNGVETLFANNTRHLVHSGDKVKAGTPVSITGETGRATTDHLHFEVRINATPIDPRLLINFESQTLQQKRLVFSLDKQGKIKITTI
ncbi:MAG: M23 family metallopeptidase [Odoribacter sp.]|nr:M23 family metallopeptidase [Odoribacter sp.]